ncbi:MAG: hypothetical protein M0C28_23555 [Candidatus Moduliflexus flocculans]|nr:hypothetical protein [Candidatus Moduliflexus flocculans]
MAICQKAKIPLHHLHQRPGAESRREVSGRGDLRGSQRGRTREGGRERWRNNSWASGRRPISS